MKTRRCCECGAGQRASGVAFNQTKAGETDHAGPHSYRCIHSPCKHTHRYKLADSFVSITQQRALEYISKDTERLDLEIDQLKATVDQCEEEMKKLKVVLYGKFGNNINLERD